MHKTCNVSRKIVHLRSQPNSVLGVNRVTEEELAIIIDGLNEDLSLADGEVVETVPGRANSRLQRMNYEKPRLQDSQQSYQKTRHLIFHFLVHLIFHYYGHIQRPDNFRKVEPDAGLLHTSPRCCSGLG